MSCRPAATLAEPELNRSGRRVTLNRNAVQVQRAGAADAAGLASFVVVDDLVDTFILPPRLGRHDFADEIYRQNSAVVELSITDGTFRPRK